MTTSIRATSKSRGRPKTTGQGLQIPVRVHDPLLSALDAFAADQGEAPLTRPEAMRRAATEHLRAKGYLPATSGESA